VGSWCQVKYRRDPQVRKLFMYFRRSMGWYGQSLSASRGSASLCQSSVV
jgi:hypothetical protein